jgi:uncharacterized protein YbjT (DUF2867 family)
LATAMKVVIIGATGTIGKAAAAALKAENGRIAASWSEALVTSVQV